MTQRIRSGVGRVCEDPGLMPKWQQITSGGHSVNLRKSEQWPLIQRGAINNVRFVVTGKQLLKIHSAIVKPVPIAVVQYASKTTHDPGLMHDNSSPINLNSIDFPLKRYLVF